MAERISSGNKAGPLPTNAAAGFASASSLLQRSSPYNEDVSLGSVKSLVTVKQSNLQKRNQGTVKPRRPKDDEEKAPKFKNPNVIHQEKPEPMQEAIGNPLATISDHQPLASNNPPLKKVRKQNSKDESQTKIKKAKVTKPGTVNERAKSKKSPKLSKKASKAATTETQPPITEKDVTKLAGDQWDLGLEEAISRRKDWTPVKDSSEDAGPLQDATISLKSPSAIALPQDDPLSVRFGSLLDDYGFAQESRNAVVQAKSTRVLEKGVIAKRRKIELVNGVPYSSLPAENPKRSKLPRKKPQTITEKATAPFVPPHEALPIASLLPYLAPPPPLFDTPTNARGKIKSIFPATNPEKEKIANAKSKKQGQKAPILLSPQTAIKMARDQELIFGTSSQLAREESPTFIRDLQQAIKQSESMDDQGISQRTTEGSFEPPFVLKARANSFAMTPSKNLWSVAARSFEGDLLDAEVCNLADTPKPYRPDTESDNTIEEPKKELELTALPRVSPGGWNVVEDISSPHKEAVREALLISEIETVEPAKVLPRCVAEAALKIRPKSRSPEKKRVSSARSGPEHMPNYSGFTDFQLSREIASNGFKAIRKRQAMIALLEKCWESRRNKALQELPANISLHKPTNADVGMISKQISPAKRRGRPQKNTVVSVESTDKDKDLPLPKPRGRPKKDPTTASSLPTKRKAETPFKAPSKAATEVGDEIYDSSPPTPSPPRRRSPTKLPKKLNLSPPRGLTKPTSANQIEPVENRIHIFSKITEAITTYPPTHSPIDLTFYEKMLMYDPIVLEDLAVWLNTIGLGRVNEDSEVEPGLVKEWCEARSVCCLWRENLRGGTRERL